MYKIIDRPYKEYRTIDFHTHTGTDLSLAAATEREHIASSVKDLIKTMDISGVEKAVTFCQPIPKGEHKEYNNQLTDEINKDGEGRLIQLAYINPYEKDSADLLETLITKNNVGGVKMHPLFDNYPDNYNRILSQETMPIFELAQKHNLPVAIHSGWGVKVGSIIEVAKAFPQLTVGVLHLLEDVFPCKDYDNMFVETSYASHPRRIRQVVEKLGSERVVFGSDFAWSDQLVEKLKILRTPLPEKDIENILYNNAKRILNLKN